jgi:hypothetical protein
VLLRFEEIEERLANFRTRHNQSRRSYVRGEGK